MVALFSFFRSSFIFRQVQAARWFLKQLMWFPPEVILSVQSLVDQIQHILRLILSDHRSFGSDEGLQLLSVDRVDRRLDALVSDVIPVKRYGHRLLSVQYGLKARRRSAGADGELLPEEEFADVEEALLPHPAIIAAQRTPVIIVAANLFFI